MLGNRSGGTEALSQTSAPSMAPTQQSSGAGAQPNPGTAPQQSQANTPPAASYEDFDDDIPF